MWVIELLWASGFLSTKWGREQPSAQGSGMTEWDVWKYNSVWHCKYSLWQSLMVLLFTYLCIYARTLQQHRILVPWPGIELVPLAAEVWSLNLWSTRGVPLSFCFFFFFFFFFEPSSVPVALHTCLLIITMNLVSVLRNPYLPGEGWGLGKSTDSPKVT